MPERRRFAFVAEHRHVWPVSWPCEALDVSRSGFHAWLTRPISAHAVADEQLSEQITRSFQGSRHTYGARRPFARCPGRGPEQWPASGGTPHADARPARQAKAPRAAEGRRGPVGHRRQPARSGLPSRSAEPEWLADFTCVWTAEGWLPVAAVPDLFSRGVVGWSMKAERDASLVMDALMRAVWRRGKADALRRHSDQGRPCGSEQFQRLMADHGITCSMSRSGNVWDNSAMECFFSSLTTERTARKAHRTRDAARADVFDYVERFSNPTRRHSTLGHLSPVGFERQAVLP